MAATRKAYDVVNPLEGIPYHDGEGKLVGWAEITFDGDGDIVTVTYRDADGNAIAVETHAGEEG